MPIYDYDCAACGRRIEVVHGVYAPGPTHCPNCGAGPLRKAISAPAVHFKGSGWAKRDRRATVTPGVSKASTDASSASDSERKDSERKDGERKDSERKDGEPRDGDGKDGGTAAESKSGTASEAGSAGGGKRAAAATPSPAAGTATKAD